MKKMILCASALMMGLAITSCKDKAAEDAQASTDSLQNEINAADEALNESFSTDEVNGVLDEEAGAVEDAAEDAVEAGEDVASDALEAGKSAAEDAMAAGKAAAEEAMAAGKAAAENLSEDVKAAAKDAAKELTKDAAKSLGF